MSRCFKTWCGCVVNNPTKKVSQPKQKPKGQYRNFAARSPLSDEVMKDEKKKLPKTRMLMI